MVVKRVYKKFWSAPRGCTGLQHMDKENEGTIR